MLDGRSGAQRVRNTGQPSPEHHTDPIQNFLKSCITTEWVPHEGSAVKFGAVGGSDHSFCVLMAFRGQTVGWGRRRSVLVNNRMEGNAPLRVQGLVGDVTGIEIRREPVGGLLVTPRHFAERWLECPTVLGVR